MLYKLEASVVVYEPGKLDEGVWLRKDILLPFVPMEGLTLLIGSDEQLQAAAVEYVIRDLSWDCEGEHFWSLVQDNVYNSGPEGVATSVEHWKEEGWVVTETVEVNPRRPLLRLVEKSDDER